jgi:uroporphyrin-III C-methyltransferase
LVYSFTARRILSKTTYYFDLRKIFYVFLRMPNSNPTLWIVGAGPGDPDLITLKGLRAIENADVLLYDALVSKELIGLTKPSCKRVYVGKRKGKKEFSQMEINQLLVFYAVRHSCVVRLKGGDPFVFGRGHEERVYSASKGVDVKFVPGISSSYAAASCAGIPLTTRGVNESFWVVTGTVSSGEISNDLHKAVQTCATIIVLMGLSKLAQIATLIGTTRGPHEPMAVIQDASLPSQKVVTGDADTICQRSLEAAIGSPAVIVIGKTIDLRLIQNLSPKSLETINQ